MPSGSRTAVAIVIAVVASNAAADPPVDAAPLAVGEAHARDMAAGLVVFKASVRAVLVKECLGCHGGESTEAGFSLADRAALLKGGDTGAAIVPGKAAESRLLRLVTHAAEPAMPQDASKLSDPQIAAIRKWIDLGAPFDAPLTTADEQVAWTERTVPASARGFWAFRPLDQSEPPAVAVPGGNTVDRFLEAKRRDRGVEANPPADRVTQIRRATLDLIGLPPTPEEVEAFVADASPDAFEKVVDRLLADERFGERWARHWLDVARFAESHGFEQDYDRPFAYHYRDFVVQAFNSDLPYDDFVKWQLAGDEIAPENALAMKATGFVGAGVFPTQITKNEVERTRYDALDDMAATTGVAFLGLTVGCARCHDHKFDPIPQADYYRLLSTFTTTVRGNVDLAAYPAADAGDAVAAPKPVKVMIASEGITAIRHHTQGGDFLPETHYLRRGDCDQKEKVAEPDFLQVLTTHPDGAAHWKLTPPPGSHTSYRRRALADWITDTEYGPGQLAARVIVNRLWQHHFGRGLVATPNDFGAQGSPPTHPELLDFLARKLIAGGWRLKPIHRLIVRSAAYRQNSEFGKPQPADPKNETLWRFEPRRLEAEALRDSVLAVSGRLDERKYGPGTLDESHVRRSIYFTIKRSRLIAAMQIFDVPEPNTSVGGRQSTTIAPQALHFMNGPQVRASAVALADRALREDEGEPIDRAYLLCYGRLPTEAEDNAAHRFVDRVHDAGGQGIAEERAALIDLCHALLASNEFAYLP